MARLAGRSYGVVSREELLASGITEGQIRKRLQAGSLIALHRAVYSVGYRSASVEARYLAAVKAVGNEAAVAGKAAGRLFGLVSGSPPPEVITKGQRRPTGVVVHRGAGVRPSDLTVWLGIPVTTVPRTLVDLAAVLEEDELARAVHVADARHHITPEKVRVVLGRRHNWPGARKLRRVIGDEVQVTVSRLERRFLERLREASIATPVTNQRVDGRYVDCRWPARRLTVELDGYRYHRSRHAFELDRQREREARARGDEFRRYTWRDVEEEREQMLVDLHKLLDLPD